MLMNDNRECAKAVNAAMAPKAEAGPKLVDRQVEEHPRCFLFGHYDSRGGANLVPATNLVEAIGRYATNFGIDELSPGRFDPGMLHSMIEDDFMFSCAVIVCDEPIGEKCELDASYDEQGYSYGLLQFRWTTKRQADDLLEEPTAWEDLTWGGCKKTLVLWKGDTMPTIDPKVLQRPHLPSLETQIVREEYGEDACGLCWMPATE